MVVVCALIFQLLLYAFSTATVRVVSDPDKGDRRRTPGTGSGEPIHRNHNVTLCLGIHEASGGPGEEHPQSSQRRDAHHRQDLLQVEGPRHHPVPTNPNATEDPPQVPARLLRHNPCPMRTDPAGTTDASKGITRKTSIRDARDYVKRIRYPVHRVEQQKHDTTWRTILTINEDPASPLTPDDLLKVQQEVSKVLKGYGVEVRTPEREESMGPAEQATSRARRFLANSLGGAPDQGQFNDTSTEMNAVQPQGPSRNCGGPPSMSVHRFHHQVGRRKAVILGEMGHTWVCKIQLEQLKRQTIRRKDITTPEGCRKYLTMKPKEVKNFSSGEIKMLMKAGFMPL